jgi:hypothetical protein
VRLRQWFHSCCGRIRLRKNVTPLASTVKGMREDISRDENFSNHGIIFKTLGSRNIC